MPRRILIIDDSDDLREGLAIRLKAEGFDVGSFSTGDAGLTAMAEQPFDLVLLDMVMPGKDGIETYQTLRATPATRNTPVILMTAYNSPDLTDEARRLGAFAVIDKPFEMNALAPIVDHALAGRRG